MIWIFIPLLWSFVTRSLVILVQWFIYSSSINHLSYMAKNFHISVTQYFIHLRLQVDMYIYFVSKRNLKTVVFLSMLMHFICVKCLSNDLMGTGNMAILSSCKIFYSFMKANMYIIEWLSSQWHSQLFLDS